MNERLSRSLLVMTNANHSRSLSPSLLLSPLPGCSESFAGDVDVEASWPAAALGEGAGGPAGEVGAGRAGTAGWVGGNVKVRWYVREKDQSDADGSA